MTDLYVLQGEPCPICSEYPHSLPSCLHCSGTGVRANSGPITLAAALMILEREKNRTPCHNCGSRQYEWYHRSTERAHCSECSPDTPPPPKPLLKFLPCPSCNRMLTTLSEHLPPGRCCLCGAELSPPVCPHCGYDRFSPCINIPKYARFKADGALVQPRLYSFRCAKCGEEVGNLPLKRTDK